MRGVSQGGLRAAIVAAVLGIGVLLGTAGPAAAASCGGGPSRSGRIAGIVHALNVHSGCPAIGAGATITAGDTANGTPPLIYHGGAVMGTATTGPLVITPIYWDPSGYPMSSSYKSELNTYISDVARASGQRTNVFSISTEYYGTDGQIKYQIRAGKPINDTNPLPANGCKLMPVDMSGIYSDGSGYSACLTDAQVIAETDRMVTQNHLPSDYSHIYVLFLAKGVESCFYAGEVSTAKNACTINHEPSAAYCAYHSQAPSSTVYALLAYPITQSPIGYTCGSDVNFGTVEAPNHNPAADTEVSPLSHEVNEAWTDPDTQTGWYDSSGYENGDECAYVYGPTSGSPGALYNQTINRHHYLTQEEFSNQSFFASGGGCLQSGT